MEIIKSILYVILFFLCICHAYLFCVLQYHDSDEINIGPAIYLLIHSFFLYLLGKELCPKITIIFIVFLMILVHNKAFFCLMSELSSYTDFNYPLTLSLRNVFVCIIPIIIMLMINMVTRAKWIRICLLISFIPFVLFAITESINIITFSLKKVLLIVTPCFYCMFLFYLFSF